MSTLQLENIKHVDASSNALELHSDGTVTISQVNGNIKADGFYHDGTLTDNVVFSQGTSTQNAAVSLWGNDHASFPGQVHIVGNSSNASADAGTISFWDFTGSSFQKNVSIDKDGRFLNPNQPAFQAQRNSGSIASTQYAVFDSVYLNRGNHYNASNGRFTAPIDGTYLFHLHFLKRGTNYVRTGFHKNGALMGVGNSHTYTSNVDHEMTSAQWITELTAGDYVSIYVEVAGGDFYADGNAHNGFSGYLLG